MGGNTPKYGLIYNSTFIGRAGSKNKGRISRFLANKCSIASRIDCFADSPTTKFGEALRSQVEERLAFYETGSQPTKNAAAMAKVIDLLRTETADGAVVEIEVDAATSKKDKKSKKRKGDAVEEQAAENEGKKEEANEEAVKEIEAEEKAADEKKAVDKAVNKAVDTAVDTEAVEKTQTAEKK